MADNTEANASREVDAPEEPEDQRAEIQEKSEKGVDEVYCSSCGETIKKDAEICPHCGVRQKDATPPQGTSMKNPGLAAVASFFWSGLGQIYNGQIGKGILLMVLQGINVALMLVAVGYVTYPIVWIYGMWDAYKTAEKINKGEIRV